VRLLYRPIVNVMKVKIAFGIIVLWWLLQVANFAVGVV
jgi:hypothetical protein